MSYDCMPGIMTENERRVKHGVIWRRNECKAGGGEQLCWLFSTTGLAFVTPPLSAI